VAKTCKALIVEDDYDLRQLFGEVFAAEGYDFVVASNGKEMRAALEAGDVEVIIIDVGLPGGEDGLRLAKEAVDRRYGVILVTGHGKHFEAVRKSGHRYLFKPFRFPSLLALVDEVLRAVEARCVVKTRVYG
jgi:two-component system, OmpR family, response regulator